MADGATEKPKIKYESIADMGAGLIIAKVATSFLREQDINARIMKNEMQRQLTDNIKKHGQITAKQIVHNAISGFDDQSTLKELVKMLDDVDDMIESYAGKDILKEPDAELDKYLSPTVKFDWKMSC